MSARVLVVDDLLPNVKLLEAKLAREYFNVVTAFSGPEALHKAAQEAPDIILLDIMMPGMDGFEVCRRLKLDPRTRHIPVVMVTALSDTADRVRGLEAGADDFLTKPVNDIALFSRVRSLVRLKMTMDEWRMRENTSGELGVLTTDAHSGTETADGAAILVVEDSLLDRDRIARTLACDQDRLIAAGSLTEGMAHVVAEELELVVISLNLAAEDGLRLCSHFRGHERTRQTPILLLAEEGDLPRVAKGLDLGANDYLMKPIDSNELLARVRTQVRRKRYQDRLRSNYEQSLSMALTDSLTGLFNRRYLAAHLGRVLQRIAATHKPVAVVMLDIDRFKLVNDRFGHQAGDRVLVEVASRISRNLRSFDMVARYGGEEFVIVMPDATLEEGALVADRLRQKVAEDPIDLADGAGSLHVTISLGVAATDDPNMQPDAMVVRADRALYEAKGRGRNQVFALDALRASA